MSSLDVDVLENFHLVFVDLVEVLDDQLGHDDSDLNQTVVRRFGDKIGT